MFLRRTKLRRMASIRQFFQPKKGFKRPLHYFVWRLKRRPGTPEYIAKGFAIGVAVNFWPVLFTHLVVGYLFCRLIKGDLIAMFIGTLLGNPWTFAVVYPLMYKIGKVLIGLKTRHNMHHISSVEEVWKQIWPIESWHSLTVAFREILLPLSLGGFLLGLPCAILAYYIARNGVRVYQAQRRRLLLKKFATVEAEIETVAPHQ